MFAELDGSAVPLCGSDQAASGRIVGPHLKQLLIRPPLGGRAPGFFGEFALSGSFPKAGNLVLGDE